MVKVDESQLLEYYCSLVNHADGIEGVLLLYRTYAKVSQDWGWRARRDNKRNVLSGEWLSAFKCDTWSVLGGNTNIWNWRELLCTLSRSSILLRFPKSQESMETWLAGWYKTTCRSYDIDRIVSAFKDGENSKIWLLEIWGMWIRDNEIQPCM